eukprot:3512343-Lingulodinium_polyedra.AAC.1
MATDHRFLFVWRVEAQSGNAVAGPMEYQQLEVVLDSCKCAQVAQATTFVAECGQRPLFVFYPSDGTKARCGHRVVSKKLEHPR